MRYNFGTSVLIRLLCLASFAVPVIAAKPPNILIILADDLGRELLRSYDAQTDYATPRLDGFAASGMQFNNCYATPLCAPSRAELLTGRYSFRNYTNWTHLDPNQITFAQRLRQAGYATALSGKWQLDDWAQSPPGIVRAGFDEYCSFNEPRELEESAKGQGNRYWGGTIVQNGQSKKLDRYGPDVYCEMLIDFIKRNRTKPFLAYYCMPLMHRPFHPTPEHPNSTARGEAPMPDWLGARGKAENFRAMLSYADRQVGQLLDAVDELGLARSTIVIFTSDNGTDNVQEARTIRSRFMDQSVRGGKYFPTELGVNVPLLVRWPGVIEPGSNCNSLVDFTDIFPTLCELAGAGLPEKYPLDGHSMVPCFSGQHAAAKPFLYSWGNFEQNSSKYKEPAKYKTELLDVVRDERWKLYSDGRLFDLQNDFLELAPVAPQTQNSADQARDRLRQQLLKLRASMPRAW